MKNPPPPKPRIIHDNFLPDELMNNYRIKKVTTNGEVLYHPQKRLFYFWWIDMIENGGYFCLKYAVNYIHQNGASQVEYIYDLD